MQLLSKHIIQKGHITEYSPPDKLYPDPCNRTAAPPSRTRNTQISGRTTADSNRHHPTRTRRCCTPDRTPRRPPTPDFPRRTRPRRWRARIVDRGSSTRRDRRRPPPWHRIRTPRRGRSCRGSSRRGRSRSRPCCRGGGRRRLRRRGSSGRARSSSAGPVRRRFLRDTRCWMLPPVPVVNLSRPAPPLRLGRQNCCHRPCSSRRTNR
mmetsp:Transcript_747/g.1182  ORF Transcript_747/g.1182 Transcript_747/m.1182 type:complete len:207 (-) Transcript_747:69-689(-)